VEPTEERIVSHHAHDPANPEDIERALFCVPAHDRDTWVKMAMAVKSELGDSGFLLWDDWSKTADNYNPRDARDVWRSIKDGGIGIGTLFHVAQENGYRAEMADQRPKPDRNRPKLQPPEPKRDTGRYAREIWLQADWVGVPSHSYAITKGINWPAGAARGFASGSLIGKRADCIVVPIRDLQTGKLTGVQCINAEGKKQTFGSVTGNGLALGNTKNPTIPWFLVEGWASAVSIVFHHYGGAAAAICAFGKSNLEKAAEIAAAVYQPRRLVIIEEKDG
jgi:putative DNA primase/helicase